MPLGSQTRLMRLKDYVGIGGVTRCRASAPHRRLHGTMSASRCHGIIKIGLHTWEWLLPVPTLLKPLTAGQSGHSSFRLAIPRLPAMRGPFATARCGDGPGRARSSRSIATDTTPAGADIKVVAETGWRSEDHVGRTWTCADRCRRFGCHISAACAWPVAIAAGTRAAPARAACAAQGSLIVEWRIGTWSHDGGRAG